jgi:hypothetical protein
LLFGKFCEAFEKETVLASLFDKFSTSLMMSARVFFKELQTGQMKAKFLSIVKSTGKQCS